MKSPKFHSAGASCVSSQFVYTLLFYSVYRVGMKTRQCYKCKSARAALSTPQSQKLCTLRPSNPDPIPVRYSDSWRLRSALVSRAAQLVSLSVSVCLSLICTLSRQVNLRGSVVRVIVLFPILLLSVLLRDTDPYLSRLQRSRSKLSTAP